VKVIFSSTVTREFSVAVEWWRENRPAVPTLLEDEMQAVVLQLAESPNIGAPVSHPLVKGLRRLSLEGSRYHLYYRIHPRRRVVWLVRLWHMSRGAPLLPRR